MLLLLWHPRVEGGVNPEPPAPHVIVRELPGVGGLDAGARYRPSRKKRQAKADDELLQVLAIVLPLLSRGR